MVFVRCRLAFVSLAVLAALLAAAGPVLASPPGEGAGPPEPDLSAPHAPDQIVVTFKPGLSAAQRASLHAAQGAEVVKDIPQIRTQVVSVPADELENRLTAYQAIPQVEYAEPDYLAHAAYEPDDPKYSDGSQWGPQRIQAPLAWDLSRGDDQVVIAIVDMGVDLDHPDLQSELWINADEIAGNGVDDDGNDYVDDVYGWDFFNDDNDPQDDHGHGTHVAGIAAAATDNATGIAGVGYNSSIMAVKAGDGATGDVWYSDIGWSIVYAADNGADVINLSVGGYDYSSLMQNAVDYAVDAGCVLVGAVGNDSSGDPFYPAAYDDVIGVAATDQNDAAASWSNYGSHVAVAAPGTGVYSTYWDGGATYAHMSGTSMAAPHVAGLAALLLAQDGSRTRAEVRSLIENSADDLGDEGWDQHYGYGRINAYQALGTTTGQVDPVGGGSLTSADEDLALDFPGGAVTTTTTIVHMPKASPSNPPSDLVFANMSCLLNATDDSGNPIETFNEPYTLTLSYEDSDWQDAGVADENDLNLYYWNGSQWEGILPCSGCSLDTTGNELVVLLDHFSEFGLMGDKGGTTSVTLSCLSARAARTPEHGSPSPALLAVMGLSLAIVVRNLAPIRRERTTSRS